MAISGPINCHALTISGSRNCQIVGFSGSRNSQNGRQILYQLAGKRKSCIMKEIPAAKKILGAGNTLNNVRMEIPEPRRKFLIDSIYSC